MAKIPEHLINAEVGHEPEPIGDGHDSERIWDSKNQRYVESDALFYLQNICMKNQGYNLFSQQKYT